MFLEFYVKEMDAFVVRVSRWMLAILLVFGAMQQSESIKFQRKPEKLTRVVLGQTGVSLRWEFTYDGETLQSVFFRREKPDGSDSIQIASKTSGGFTKSDFPDSSNYQAKLNSELVILEVKKHQDYKYFLWINYIDSKNVGQQAREEVLVEVMVPPKITVAPERKPLAVAGKNLTLRCNASGDPRPNITWTKDGISGNQFNVSGYLLHLVNVQRKDLGSYRCTASNGFGNDATDVSIVSMKCNNDDCQVKKVGLTIVSEEWKQAYLNQASKEFKDMESRVLAAIWDTYTNNLEKQLYLVTVVTFRSGSVVATVEMKGAKSVSELLGPLEEAIKDGKLGSFNVDRVLDLNPTTPPPTPSTGATTGAPGEPPSSGARTSGLSDAEMWGIIGGCIAFVIIIVIIILVYCICKKKKNSGGASKSGKSTYSEADGYRMNRQQPPSGLGTASPAYVEARHYAPVNSARRQDDEPKPLNYADLSFNKSSAPAKQPPPYSSTEYSEPSPQKQGGQQEEGFQLWC